MAVRPFFVTYKESPYFIEKKIEFSFYSGFAESQRRKSVYSMRQSILSEHPELNLLEVSRFSDNVLGQRLSAFNLMGEIGKGEKIPVENLFQASKVYELGGPFTDLLYVSPIEAKKDARLNNSGKLKEFCLCGTHFELEPKTFFYDWIYINALKQNAELTKEIIAFNAFTDIVFNPTKSINCQARTVAIYVSLIKAGIIEDCMMSPEHFKRCVYGESNEIIYGQSSMF